MSISSRITSIEEHIGDIYNTLELGGSDLTNVNKNIVNIDSELLKRYKDYLANGTDAIWNNWDKAILTGINEATLNNTIKARMAITPKGDTYQKISTQGNNLFDEKYYNNNNLYSVDIYKYTKTRIKGNRLLYVMCQLKEGGTSQSNLYVCLSSTHNPNDSGANYSWFVNNGNVNTHIKDFTGSDELFFTFYPATTSLDKIFDNYNFWVSTDSINYEPFVPDSPSPDYPSEIKNVKGKNLFDSSDVTPSNSNTKIISNDNKLIINAIGTIGAQYGIYYLTNVDSTKNYTISFKAKKTTLGVDGEPVLKVNIYGSSDGTNYSLIKQFYQATPVKDREYLYNTTIAGYSYYRFYIYNNGNTPVTLGETSEYDDIQIEERFCSNSLCSI